VLYLLQVSGISIIIDYIATHHEIITMHGLQNIKQALTIIMIYTIDIINAYMQTWRENTIKNNWNKYSILKISILSKRLI